MKILVVSIAPWDRNNNFGKTFCDIFEGMENVEFLNIYCADGKPSNSVKAKYFQITISDLVKNLFHPTYKVGRILEKQSEAEVLSAENQKKYNKIRSHHWRIFLWIRRFIWWIGRWKSPELDKVIQDFHADLAFMPIFKETYMNAVQLHVLKIAGVKSVAYYGDDNYSLRMFSLNPFFWLDRFAQRRMVKKTIDQCEYMYVVTEIEKRECERDFHKVCKICTKGAVFPENPELRKEYRKEKHLVYTGNLGNHRWEELTHIGEALDKIDEGHKLIIYSGTPLTKQIHNVFERIRSIEFRGCIPVERVMDVQKDADILVHVESFRFQERLLVHQSFSTKLVDYFVNARCVFGVGAKDVGFIDYMLHYDAGIVATSVQEIEIQLRRLLNDNRLIEEYAVKGFNCGKRMHDIRSIQKMLREDFHNYLGISNENTAD